MTRNETESSVNSSVEYASARTRLCAGLFDWVISLLIGLGIAFVLGIVVAVIGAATHDPSDGADFSMLAIIFVPMIWGPVIAMVRYAMLALRVADGRSTPGHDQQGISIEAIDGNPLGRWRAFKRQWVGSPMVMILSFVIGPLFALDNLFDLFDISYGRWNDAISILSTILFVAMFVGAPALSIANHVWMAIDTKGRGWHDRLFGTVVVKYR